MGDEAQVQKYAQTTETLQALSPDAVLEQIKMIQELMARAMKKDEHYGIIPGCGTKPTLLKAGAEKLNFTFRLAPSYEVTVENLENGHRDYRVICTLTHIDSGKIWGQGVGSCSTLESKYRYRSNADFEDTGKPIPKDAKEKKAEYRKQGFGMKKVNGVWLWVKYGKDEKVENPDIADIYNTVLKMAKKRAQVDATLTATAASDIFTQDIEEFKPFENQHIENAHYEVIVEKKEMPPNLQKLANELGKNKAELKRVGADAFLNDAAVLIRENEEITESVLQDWLLAMKEHLTRESVK